jgi:hypothetical protein
MTNLGRLTLRLALLTVAIAMMMSLSWTADADVIMFDGSSNEGTHVSEWKLCRDTLIAAGAKGFAENFEADVWRVDPKTVTRKGIKWSNPANLRFESTPFVLRSSDSRPMQGSWTMYPWSPDFYFFGTEPREIGLETTNSKTLYGICGYFSGGWDTDLEVVVDNGFVYPLGQLYSETRPNKPTRMLGIIITEGFQSLVIRPAQIGDGQQPQHFWNFDHMYIGRSKYATYFVIPEIDEGDTGECPPDQEPDHEGECQDIE